MVQVGLLEDNPRIARVCVTMLHYAGHQVTVYEHPRDCLAALMLQPYHAVNGVKPYWGLDLLPIDVLIMDLHLPDIDGIEVLRSLCAHPLTQALPLIFCTAAPYSEIASAMMIAPHAGFVEKPFTFLQLTTAIKSALGGEPHKMPGAAPAL